MLTDEQIFDILDGAAAVELRQQHDYLLINSPEYKTYFDEIAALHFDLAALTIEQPSARFTENVLANIAFSSVEKKSWSKHLIGVFFAIMALVFVTTIALSLYYFSTSNTAIGIPKFNYLAGINTFLTDILVKVMLLANLVILLVIFDRKILKPYFINKKVSLS